MWALPILWVSNSLQRSLLGPPSRGHLAPPRSCLSQAGGSLGLDFAHLNAALDTCKVPQCPPEPAAPADVQHSSPHSSLISKKIILKKDCFVCSLAKRHFFTFCLSCSPPSSSFYFFLGFALGLASSNQNNSHNAWRFLWVNDICMKRWQSWPISVL